MFAAHFGASIAPSGHLLATDNLQLKVGQQQQRGHENHEGGGGGEPRSGCDGATSGLGPRVFVMGDVMLHTGSNEWKLGKCTPTALIAPLQPTPLPCHREGACVAPVACAW